MQRLLPFLAASGCSFRLVIQSVDPLLERLPEKDFEPSADLQQTVSAASFQLDKEQQAVGNESEKHLVFYSIVTRSIEGLDLYMLFDPLEEQLNLPAPTIDITQFFCFQIESIRNDSNEIFLRINRLNESQYVIHPFLWRPKKGSWNRIKQNCLGGF